MSWFKKWFAFKKIVVTSREGEVHTYWLPIFIQVWILIRLYKNTARDMEANHD